MKSYRLEMRDFRRIIDVIEKEIDLSEVLYSIGVAENPKLYKEQESTAFTQACFMETNTPNAERAIKHFSEVVKLIQEEDNAKL